MSTTDAERDGRLRGIRERALVATVGPWEVTGGPHSDLVIKGYAERFIATTGDPHYDGTRTDAAFIAAARTDVPWLLAEVARLDAVVTAVREVHRSGWVMNLPDGDSDLVCGGCGYIATDEDDPCPTVRALDGGAA